MTQPRVPRRPSAEWGDDVRDALSVLNGRPIGKKQLEVKFDDSGPGITAIYAWHPPLAKAWLTFSQHLSRSTLPARTREILILRVSLLRRGDIEWVQHVKIGLDIGLTEAEIDAIRSGPDDEIWSDFDAATVRAVDEICVDRYISDRTWTTLAEQLSRVQLMDLVFTAGAYDLHAMAFNTFGLTLDPNIAQP